MSINKVIRLDKVLAHMGYGTRNELRKVMKKGIVTVDGKIVKDQALKVDPVTQEIRVGDEKIFYREFIYLMMNKPADVISATEDRKDKTVLDLLSEEYRKFLPFPVGRLDKDTEGLLILTNDGAFAHNITAPKKKVPKIYSALIRGEVGQTEQELFAAGVLLEDGYKTKPAELVIIAGGTISDIQLTITEGKYHQVKRMFGALNMEVLYLKRLRIGKLELDEVLKPGEYRELTKQEIETLTGEEGAF